MSTTDEDSKWMRRALREARKGIGRTCPNPPVGCVIVRRGTKLTSGWHRKAGTPHAEAAAISAAKERSLVGATLYVTLEPCSTEGRTPPCVDAIIGAKISRVVYGATDPNPEHVGRAQRLLKKAGIEVSAGCLSTECEEVIAPFAKWITTGLPYVIAKAGMSLDGKITRPRGESQWITSEEARADAQGLRFRSGAILVGAETVRADNPQLTLRGSRIKEQPWRVVLTRSGKLPKKAHLFTDSWADRTLVFEKKSLRQVLRSLGKRGVTTVLVEGGGQVHAEAFSKGLVDEVCFYVAPLIAGSGKAVVDAAAFSGGSHPLSDMQVKRVGTDLRISGRIR